MNFIKWKFRQLKKWMRTFILYRGYWKKLWLSESDNATWEIMNDNKKKEITLLYVPEDNYSDNDVRIKVSHKEFEDLVKFILSIR